MHFHLQFYLVLYLDYFLWYEIQITFFFFFLRLKWIPLQLSSLVSTETISVLSIDNFCDRLTPSSLYMANVHVYIYIYIITVCHKDNVWICEATSVHISDVAMIVRGPKRFEIVDSCCVLHYVPTIQYMNGRHSSFWISTESQIFRWCKLPLWQPYVSAVLTL